MITRVPYKNTVLLSILAKMLHTAVSLLVATTTIMVAMPNTTMVQASANYSDHRRLYQHLTGSDYDTNTRPVLKQSLPLYMHMDAFITTILGVDEVAQTLEVLVWFNISWFDELRVWNTSAEYAGIEVVQMKPEDIWLPKIQVADSVEERDVFSGDLGTTTIWSDGFTMWQMGTQLKVSCRMDFTHFPFDVQTCKVLMGFPYFANELQVTPVAGDSRFNQNGEWEVLERSFEIVDNEYLLYGFYEIIKLRRRPKFIIVTVILPMMCLNLLSSMVFVLPRESGERASFSITTLLSLTMYMSYVTSDLPQNSEHFPILLVFIFCLATLSCAAVVVSIAQMRFTTGISETADLTSHVTIPSAKVGVEPYPHNEKYNNRENITDASGESKDGALISDEGNQKPPRNSSPSGLGRYVAQVIKDKLDAVLFCGYLVLCISMDLCFLSLMSNY